MISLADLTRSFIMTGRLLRLDYSGVNFYARDGRTAWESLRVWIILLPLALTTSWPENPEFFSKTGLTALNFALIAMSQMAIAVLGFYLMVARITRRIGQPERFAHYVTVQNWGALPIWLALSLFVVVSRTYFPATDENNQTEFVLRLFLLYYSFAMTTATLGLKKLPTIILCLLELFFGYFIQISSAFFLALTLTKP